jgi:hypothetical protein
MKDKDKVVMFNFIDGQKEIRVGDTIVISSPRSRKGDMPRTQTILKIGNKLITTEREKFYIETGRAQQEYGLPDGAYSSIAAYSDCVEKSVFINKVQQELQGVRLTYEEAVSVKHILDQRKKD